MRSYRELKVWQRSFDLCKRVYDLSRGFPADERFGLVAQMRRAVVSIPSNIAEGHSRNTTRDYLRFLWITKGSLAEVETQVILAREFDYAAAEECQEVLNELDQIGRMLRAIITSLDAKAKRPDVGSDRPTQSSTLNPQP